MRLNKNTYPAYMLLEQGDTIHVPIDKLIIDHVREAGENEISCLMQFSKAMDKMFKQAEKRYYITEPFKQAITAAYPKIKDGLKQFNDIPTDCGILFTNGGFTLYLSNPTDKKLKLIAYGFTRNALTTFAFLTTDNRFGGVACSLTPEGKPHSDDAFLQEYINGVLTAIYFIHNCETEQRVVKPKEKYRSGGEKHFNESNTPFVILDCKWFTELVRDTPFHVRGHLRWQAHGEGKRMRKLIWIDDFEKKGYHRRATKESAAA